MNGTISNARNSRVHVLNQHSEPLCGARLVRFAIKTLLNDTNEPALDAKGRQLTYRRAIYRPLVIQTDLGAANCKKCLKLQSK